MRWGESHRNTRAKNYLEPVIVVLKSLAHYTGFILEMRPLYGIAIFVLTRLILFFGYGRYISDVHLYYSNATQGIAEGKSAYLDFHFPYPPLSLPFVYLPRFFSNDFESYWVYFRAEMLLIDLLGFLFLFRLCTQIEMADPQKGWVLALYSILSLGVGHLIYDRIDIIIALVFTISLLGARWLSPAVLGAGVLTKLVPLFWAPVLWISRFREAGWKELLRHGGVSVVLPSVLFLIYAFATQGKLMDQVGEHGVRGIQVESTWATPIWIQHLLSDVPVIKIDNRYGAQHIGEGTVSPIYLFLAKYMGFGILILLFGVVFRYVRKWDFDLLFITTFFVITFLLASQRVLSPQYFVWLLPGISLYVVKYFNPLRVAAAAILYLLTYIGFSLGYWDFVKGNPLFVLTIAVRNLILVAFTGSILLHLARLIRLQLPVQRDT